MTTVLILSALFMGAAIGFWRGSDYGKDKGYDQGYLEGYEWAFEIADRDKPKRNIRGRFTK